MQQSITLTTKTMKAPGISSSDYELINKWRLTGRTAYIQPRKGIISLNGTNYEYAAAISRIKEFLLVGTILNVPTGKQL